MSAPAISNDTRNQILHWFATGNVGISSKCIASTMLGIEVAGFDAWTPSDPSDFCRCLKLIRCAPEIRQHLGVMRSVSSAWNTLVDHWDEIEACFMAEVPCWLDGKDSAKRATRTYDLMELRARRKP